ncbi:MAG TPA: CocE/NonD family hydrolase [Solirubrobacteraceae bacterium]|nr:CocE/NonD family hydrolase [Solirubrobacteraceae bacterium]
MSRVRRAGAALLVAGMSGLCAAGSAAATTPSPPAGAPAVESAPASVTGLSPQLPASVQAASAAPHSHWVPEKAIYGTASRNDITVIGAGGTPIRVNEIYPTLADGQPAPGKFPVVLTMTPYGKGQGGSSAPGSAQTASGGSATGGPDDYLVQRGYINVVEDVRGTGDSGGSFGLFDPIQTQDAIKVLHWAAALPNSDGRVGTYGPSYLGIDQLLLAGAVGRHSPLKAIFPMVPANDIYRDTSFMGGLMDSEFDLAYLGLTTALNQGNPAIDGLSDTGLLAQLAQLELTHANSVFGYDAALTAGILGGGDPAYDQNYWKARSPQTTIANVVRNGIPAYIVGGEFDIFQHGEPLDYVALQNAWDHRPTTAPMLARQRTTGRYQLIDGPWEHLNASSVDVNALELEWFDTWLKGERTGMAKTPTPMHYYDLGTGNYTESATFPFANAHPSTLYLNAGGTLTDTAPTQSGSDTLLWSPVGGICGRSVDQWSMGAISIPASEAGILAPCVSNDAPSTLEPTQRSYTTAPLTRAETIAGPLTATVDMTANTTDTELVAELEEVTPDGSAFPITQGALLGSQRAVDPRRSWTVGGATLLPYHPYTRAAAQPVVPGQMTRYQVEIFPTLITVAKGDRIRLTLATADTPHLTPVPGDLEKMIGGVYSVAHSPADPSSLTLDLIP